MSKIVAFIKNWRNYKKAIFAGILALTAWASASLADGTISLSEWLALLPALAAGPGTFAITNEPSQAVPLPVPADPTD